MSKAPSPMEKDLSVRYGWLGDRLMSPVALMFLILLCCIGLRIYKAHYTGIIHDEAWTYEDYCRNMKTAVGSYASTNNHLLNSVFIVLVGKFAGHYEHFIRIPAVIFGTVFCCALAYVLHKTISSAVLKVVVLALILTNGSIVDLTILARGYAIALGAVYTGIAVLMRLAARQDEQKQVGWWCVLFLIAMNFVALGSMLSSLSVLVCINAAFFTIAFLGAMKSRPRAVVGVMVRFVAVAAGSIGSLFLLYRHVLPKIVPYARNFEFKTTFTKTLNDVLYMPLIYDDFMRAASINPIYRTTLVLLILCAMLCIGAYVWGLAARRKTRSAFFPSPALVILALTVGLVLMMFVQSSVLGVSLGLPRNSIFLLPLAIISAAIIMDRAGGALRGVRSLFVIQQSACALVLAALCYANLPSPHSIVVRPYDWGKQSAVGPLVRTLRDIDPDRQWKILLNDPYTDCLARSIRYYERFGFKVSRAKDDYDVSVCRPHKLDQRVVYFDNERYADYHCLVIANPAAFRNERVYFQMRCE